jgi:hypothetical protein
VRAAALAAAPLAALASAGCKSQWYQVSAEDERVVTHLEVRSVPSGAMIFLNDAQMDTTPVRIPMAYPHEVSLWERQTNVGNRIRESTGVLGTIFLFPIWIPASLVHQREELKRHDYGFNVHKLRARFGDGSELEREIRLEGEAEMLVEFAAPPQKAAPAGASPAPAPAAH